MVIGDPAHLTAFGFAVVGNFEEAVNGWRRDAMLWKHGNEGVILASAAGAVDGADGRVEGDEQAPKTVRAAIRMSRWRRMGGSGGW